MIITTLIAATVATLPMVPFKSPSIAPLINTMPETECFVGETLQPKILIPATACGSEFVMTASKSPRKKGAYIEVKIRQCGDKDGEIITVLLNEMVFEASYKRFPLDCGEFFPTKR